MHCVEYAWIHQITHRFYRWCICNSAQSLPQFYCWIILPTTNRINLVALARYRSIIKTTIISTFKFQSNIKWTTTRGTNHLSSIFFVVVVVVFLDFSFRPANVIRLSKRFLSEFFGPVSKKKLFWCSLYELFSIKNKFLLSISWKFLENCQQIHWLECAGVIETILLSPFFVCICLPLLTLTL